MGMKVWEQFSLPTIRPVQLLRIKTQKNQTLSLTLI